LNILLVNYAINVETEEFNSPPLGLAYIAAIMEDGGYNVKVISLTPEQIENESWKDIIIDYSPNIVGSTLITPLYNDIIDFFVKLKSLLPSLSIIVGGPHAAALPDDVIKESTIDFVVRGEGELVIRDLLFSIKNNSNISHIKGLTYKKGPVIVHNENADSIEDLDALPFPAWHLFDIRKFQCMLGEKKIMGLMGSRGCPYDCIFCYRGPSNNNKTRFRNLENIFEEIYYLVEQHRLDGINFWDDIFTLNKDRTKEFCLKFKKYFPNLIWYCQTRIDCLDEELLLLMEGSGCRLIRLGIESGDDSILRLTNKKISTSIIKDKFKLIKQHKDIKTKAYFILGFPGETKESIIRTLDFAKELSADETMFFNAIPYPGSKLYDWISKQRCPSSNDDFSQYNHFCSRDNIIPFFPIRGMINSEFVNIIKKANADMNIHKIY
jgi:anaerobic magnesium-protoporphyrin IX monomethyl ester cyclase